MKWTEQEDRILEVTNGHATSLEISAILNLLGRHRTPSAIRNRKLLLQVADNAPLAHNFVDYVQENFDNDEIAAILGVLGFQVEEAVEEIEEPGNSSLSEPPSSSQKAAATKRIKEVKQDIIETLKEIAANTTDHRVLITPTSWKPNAESLVLVLSDLHVGKKVEDEHGNELYNVAIAEKRILSLTDKVLYLGDRIDKASLIDEVVVVLAGDIIDSEGIYETQAYHLDKTLIWQIRTATSAIWTVLKALAERYPNVRVVTCRGNHGRTGGAESSNFDNIIYFNLEILAQETGLPITISSSLARYNKFKVKGHTGLVRHEVPKPDSTPTANAKYGGWAIEHGYDFIISGHYHQARFSYFHNKPIFRNGSLVGGDDLSEEMAVGDAPKQLLFGVSEHHLPSFIYPLSFEE